MKKSLKEFTRKLDCGEMVVGVVGLGYVGLPLSISFLGSKKIKKVIGFDIDEKKRLILNSNKTYLKHIDPKLFYPSIESGKFEVESGFMKVPECDALIVCVPTPLNSSREPDTSFIENSVKSIVGALSSKHSGPILVSLESSTYPGTTSELVKGVLDTERPDMKVGKDYFLVFSPEREDPGNMIYKTHNIPKVVGGCTKECLLAGMHLYRQAVQKVIPVSSTQTAEMVKLLENTYRAVNIALVNELKMICDRMSIDVWEVIQAASTKPFGYQAFWPGPGLGGHCIPIDPFYLTWKARQFDINTKFIELAGEINTNMPYYVVEKVQDALNNKGISTKGSKILILGVAYKANIDDMRESPALKIIELLQKKGSVVSYHDPFVSELHKTREHNIKMKSTELSKKLLASSDCVVIVTKHSSVDYHMVAENAKLIVDTRGAYHGDEKPDWVVSA